MATNPISQTNTPDTNASIGVLALSTGTRNSALRGGIVTVGQLRRLSRERLRATRQIGPKSISPSHCLAGLVRAVSADYPADVLDAHLPAIGRALGLSAGGEQAERPGDLSEVFLSLVEVMPEQPAMDDSLLIDLAILNHRACQAVDMVEGSGLSA
jgi:Bacterial RNA polymerase, alpha chain C terminal domain